MPDEHVLRWGLKFQRGITLCSTTWNEKPYTTVINNIFDSLLINGLQTENRYWFVLDRQKKDDVNMYISYSPTKSHNTALRYDR